MEQPVFENSVAGDGETPSPSRSSEQSGITNSKNEHAGSRTKNDRRFQIPKVTLGSRLLSDLLYFGLILTIGVVSLFADLSVNIPHELSWALIGIGLGGAFSSFRAELDRNQTAKDHREHVSLMLTTLSGTPRQAFRIGVSLADMLVDQTRPSNDERSVLLTNANALGIRDLLLAFAESKARTFADAQQIIIGVRGFRGRRTSDALKVGFEIEMLAARMAARPSVALSNEVLDRLRGEIDALFPLEPRVEAWLTRNWDQTSLLPQNRLAFLRQVQYIIWQSRHLQPYADACGCSGNHCVRRERILEDLRIHLDGSTSNFPRAFYSTLVEREHEQNLSKLEELKAFDFVGATS